MPQHTQYSASYDENGDVILSYHESSFTNPAENSQSGYEENFQSSAEVASHIPSELHGIPPQVSHVRFVRLWKAMPHANHWHLHMTAETLRFAGTFTAVFLFLFLSLNYQSYEQMVRATLLPDARVTEQRALDAMTNPFLKKKLLSVPELPRAGRASATLVAAIPEVAPPDNRLVIPKIGINVPIVEATDAALKRRDFDMFDADIQNALKFGVVHYPGTANPGEIGNVFLTAHSSNYPWVQSNYNAVFALLPRLEIGDEYSIFYDGELHQYRITEKFEVSPKDVSVLAQPQDNRMSTLMTCTPVGTTLRRLILKAEEIEKTPLLNANGLHE